jgi:hypothetical protein
MSNFRAWIFSTLSILALLPMTQHAVAKNPVRTMPAITAADLNGRELSFPGELSGNPAVWVVAFDRDQQAQVDRLFGLLATAKTAQPGLVYWEMPVIQNPSSVIRWIIDNGMRRGIPSRETRAKVVTLYVPDRDAWSKQVGISTRDQASAVLIGRNGEIHAVATQTELKTSAAMKEFLAKATAQ